MKFPLRIHSSVTNPTGYLDEYVVKADSVLTLQSGDIRVTYKTPTLQTIGVLPSSETDSVNEFASCDNATTTPASSNHTDSNAFDTNMVAKSYTQRGKARDNGTYSSVPTNFISRANYDFMKHGGVQLIWFTMCPAEAEKRQVRQQADWLYWSGHGHQSNATLSTLDQEFDPSDAQWNKELDVVILAGSSVLDIKDYRAQSFGVLTYAEWLLACGDWSPGAQWENTGSGYFLGYNWSAPTDVQGSAGIVNSLFSALNGGASIPAAWGQANNLAIGRNACVIDTTTNPYEYWYWNEQSGTPVWTNVVKRASGG